MRPLYLLEHAGYEAVDADALADPRVVRGLNTPAAYLDAVREAIPGARARLTLRGRARRQRGRSSFQVPVGTLAEVLRCAGPELTLCSGGELALPYRVSLNGRPTPRDTALPVGPAEEVIVMDAMAGS